MTRNEIIEIPQSIFDGVVREIPDADLWGMYLPLWMDVRGGFRGNMATYQSLVERKCFKSEVKNFQFFGARSFAVTLLDGKHFMPFVFKAPEVAVALTESDMIISSFVGTFNKPILNERLIIDIR